MRSEFLQFAPPLIGEEEIEEVVRTLRSGWITTGQRAQDFETEFRNYVGASSALAVNSATSAMQVALAALGIGEGDAVITTTMTFVSTIHVIEHQGARPILVDVEPDTLNIDPDQVEAALRKSTGVKAILPVHLYGHPAEMDRIYDIATRHRLAVLEDAAHALPARYRGRVIGAPAGDFHQPNAVAFSFYATKNLTTGEGGMLTGPLDLIDDARVWSLHGMSRDAFKRYTSEGSWRYDVVLPGVKYNMPDIQAAMVLAQLRARNIGASLHFIPIHMHSYYRDHYQLRPDQFPVATREFERMLSLPLSPAHSDQDVADVIEAVTDIVSRNRA